MFMLATFCAQSWGTECFHTRSALPVLFHCRDLTNAIAWLAHQPGENDLKSWGRHLPTTARTQSLPKLYYIVGAVLRTTCAVQVDVDQTDALAVDSFRQSDVAVSASNVVDRCLVRQQLLGSDFPGEAAHVYVMILRIDASARLELSRAHDVQDVKLPGSADVLRILTGYHPIYGIGVYRGNNSLSRVDDQ
ncbi:MAG: hypothetical protein Q9191_008043 [Dirinaria sp. TL-2023a]